MKNIILIFTLISVFIVKGLSQEEYNGDQLITSSHGKFEITFKILDFETNEPLIGAEVFSKDLNKVLSMTDTEGITTIKKYISKNFRIEYIGYDSYCFKLSDTTVDQIVVRLISMEFGFGDYVGNRFADSLGFSRNWDAIKDIDSGKIQLYRYTEPTNEQKELANNYGFTFRIYNGNSSDYIYRYNEEDLNFISKKYHLDIRANLFEVCRRNKKFFN